MRESASTNSLSSIIHLGEELHVLIKELDIEQLESMLPDYTKKIEHYFLNLDNDKFSHADLDDLKQVISTHKKAVNLIDEEKEKISKKLKQLHVGREMQNTYTQAV